MNFALEDPEPLLYHNEPIYRDGKLVGNTSFRPYGHHLGRAIAMGYVRDEGGVDAGYVAAGKWEIESASSALPRGRASGPSTIRPAPG